MPKLSREHIKLPPGRDGQAVHAFVATSRGQGQRPNDFCFVPEGELVMVPLVLCDEPGADSACGCRRALDGVRSGTGTTTACVVQIDGGRAELTRAIRDHLNASSLLNFGDTAATVRRSVDIILTHARRFPVGAIVEWRDGRFYQRTCEPTGQAR